jgi:outer membrane protein, multidrug efflux system
MRKLLYIAIAVLLLGACKAGKPYQGADVLVPEQFKADLSADEEIKLIRSILTPFPK